MKICGNTLSVSVSLGQYKKYHNSALSIWLSVDPMSDKYPSTSPYTYCANNPVRLVDPDGEDYIVVIENKAEVKSITIKAHYKVYGTDSEFATAESAVQEWNNQSGRYILKADNDDEYTINFELTIERVFDKKDLSYTESQDNTIDFVDKLETEQPGAIGEALSVNGTGQRKINILREWSKKQPVMHEIGHTLGLRHSNGVMGEYCTYMEENIYKNHVGGILNHAGFEIPIGKKSASIKGADKVIYNQQPFSGRLWENN